MISEPARRLTHPWAGAALVYGLLPLSIAVGLYQGRFWLTPTLPAPYMAWLLMAACAALPPLLLGRLRDPRARAEAAALVAFFLLWTTAWRPETRALGIAFGAACCTLMAMRRFTATAAGVLLLLLAMALAGYERTYGPLDAPAVQALLQTHTAEAAAFVWQELNPSSMALAALLVLVGAVLSRLASTLEARRRLACVGLAVLLVAMPFAGKDAVEKGRVFSEAYRQLAADSLRTGAPPLRFAQTGHASAVDVVLILGESTSRRLMRLYGAPLATTPALSALEPSLVVMTDVVSAHSHTVPSVRSMMYRDAVAENAADPTLGPVQVSLVEVLRQAGVRVDWISAQAAYGKWSGPILRLATRADEVLFTNPDGGGAMRAARERDSPDARATAAVLSTLASPPAQSRLIVQHMFASHWPYCAHRPSEPIPAVEPAGAAWFGDAVDRTEDLRCYANAVRFVDEQVGAVIRAAQATQRPTIVIYTPDHGEDPEGGTGHSASLHVATHVEVPFVVHFNAPARLLLPRQAEMLQQHRTQPFMNAWTYELVLDLLGVVTSDLRFEVASVASAEYRPKPRLLFPRDARVHYDRRTEGDRKDPLEWTRLNLRELRDDAAGTGQASQRGPAVYAHRVNSVAKALDAKADFDGIELDLHYDSAQQNFQVFHPPTPDVGLRLEHLLAATADRPALKYWLDFKNADRADARAVLQRLDALDKTWRIKQRTLIELPETVKAAEWQQLSAAGWAVSLYLPYALAECATRNSLTVSHCTTSAATALQAARALGAQYLSFDISVLPAVLLHMDTSRRGALKLLTWQLRTESSEPTFSDELTRVTDVHGVIVGFRSKFGR